jgi:hypothetical protein
VKSIFIISWFLLAGCATNSGVVPIGQDTYKIYKRGATGFSGSEAVKSDVLIQASEYCAGLKKSLHVVSMILGRPPYIMGNFPKAEVQFKCLGTKELELARASEKTGTEIKQQGAPPKSDDIYTELKKLKGLLDDGIITHQEFDAKKKKILAK